MQMRYKESTNVLRMMHACSQWTARTCNQDWPPSATQKPGGVSNSLSTFNLQSLFEKHGILTNVRISKYPKLDVRIRFVGSVPIVLCFVGQIPLKGGPEPSEKLIRKVLVPIGRFHFYFIPVPKQIRPYHPTWYISRTGWSVFRSARR